MFCRNCGNELKGTPEVCFGCRAKPLVGSNFCHACGAATNPLAEICINCGTRLGKAWASALSPKSRLATTLLAFFLGGFGAHRFYTGKIATAVEMLILSIVGYVTIWNIWWLGLICLIAVNIWAFIDFIFAVLGKMTDRAGKLIKNW